MEDPRMKIRLGLVLMLACGLALAGCASGGGGGSGPAATRPSTPGAQTLAQGERPRQTEHTRAAQRHLNAGDDEDDPGEAQAHFDLALTSAMAAIAEDGRNPLGHRQAALANLALKDYSAAGAHFDHAAELRPIYEFEDQGIRERAWIELYGDGSPLVNSGDYEGAATVFENANAIYSERPEAMVTLAQIHASLRNHDAALENITAALAIINSDKISEMDSTTAAAWREQADDLPSLRAQVLADAGRFEEAAVAYRGLVAADPDDLVAARNFAGILIQMGDEAAAFVEYEKLMARSDLAAADFYTIGVGYYTGSAYARASQAFEGAATRNVNDRDALEMWARSLQLDSAFMAIPAVGDRWIALDPFSQSGYLVMAQAVNQNGDEQRARDLISAIDEFPVQVGDLQITRLGDGGARVTGSVGNKSLDQGTVVTFTFTFYTPEGDPMGTLTHQVTVGAQDMNEVFQVEYTTEDQVGGYGYTLSVG
jgi:tetratricopeptide (TPR) repeat protein